jgi:DNA-binding transcriptional LysR family regulator
MLEAVTLDQLRIFIAAAEAGSFSAAARRLKRAQSVISQSLANLEDQLGVVLFDRTGRMPVLTEQGRALIEEARAVAASMDSFKARAKGLAGGLEPELSVVVDVMFPIGLLTAAVSAFHTHFPNTPLRLYVEALGAVLQPVLDGSCAFGIMGSLPTAPAQMVMERLLTVRMVIVAAASHPLSAHNAPCPKAGNSACFRPRPGAWPIWARNMRSYWQVWALAACRSTPCKPISPAAIWSSWRRKIGRPTIS